MRNLRYFRKGTVLVVICGLGCGIVRSEKSGQGAIGEPCYPGGTCDNALVCIDDKCVTAGEPGDFGGPCLEGDICDEPYVCVDGFCKKDLEGEEKELSVVELLVTPSSWHGYGLFEQVVFTCSARLSNNIMDEGCKILGMPVTWSSLGNGYFVVPETGETAETTQGGIVRWNTGHNVFRGVIQVEYAGAVAEVPVQADHPDDMPPPSYWSHAVLPDLTNEEVMELCETGTDEFIQEQNKQADQLSESLTAYIQGWLAGDNPSEIPPDYLPVGIDNEKTPSWRLFRPDEIDPESQWYIYPARDEPWLTEFSRLLKNNAPTHVTYLKLHFLAPFGARLVVEGEFPRARFMSCHISPPFDPKFPYASNVGQLEVPIADVDIDPSPGSVNPFRQGENRNADNRRYELTFDLLKGNMVSLNPVLQNEYFSHAGNNRAGGPFSATGPVGGGQIIPPVLWIRYYVPDEGTGPLAGVPLPRATLELETGERFWLQPDLEFLRQRQVKEIPGVDTNRLTFVPEIIGPSLGWMKMFDIFLVWLEGRFKQAVLAECPSRPNPELCEGYLKAMLRSHYECRTNKGPDKEPPGNIGHSATDNPYNRYLVRPTQFIPGSVYALSGRKPTTPYTRDGAERLDPAEARYWSVCHTGTGPDGMYNGVVYGCLLDEVVVVDEEQDYVIVFSRGSAHRPENATSECGVTWRDIGPEWRQTFVLRWNEVYPEHYSMSPHVPNDENIPWSTAAWSQDEYDEDLVGRNEPGVMGAYHPVLHHMKVEEFEALGCPIDKSMLPLWR